MKVNYVGYNFTHVEKYRNERVNGAESDIIVITKSPSIITFGSEKKEVPENSVVIIKSHTPYIHEAVAGNYRDDWMHFVLDDDEKKKYPLPYNTFVCVGDITTLSFYIEKIHNEMYMKGANFKRKIELFFELFYLEFKEKTDLTETESGYINTIFNLRADIYYNPHRRIPNCVYANRVGMSLSHFQRFYKKTFGVSPTEDAILARIERAKYLLKNSNRHVSEIAEILGYQNEIQFMRQFKKVTGVTALQYRKNHNAE